MSGKLMSVLVALGLLSSVAIALTVTPSGFGTFVVHRAYPTKADFDRIFAEVTKLDFDWVFAKVEFASTLDPEHTLRREQAQAGLSRRLDTYVVRAIINEQGDRILVS